MKKEDLKHFKKILKEEKERIISQLKNFAQKENGNWKASFPKFNGESSLETAADEVEEYASRLSLEFNLEKRLKEIDLALEKIEKGIFGVCEKCKKEIEVERLKANPTARFCKNCKR